MRRPERTRRSHCPVNYGLECFGDPWALLILRDIIFRGKKTFGEFLKSEEKFATNILASRLRHLVNQGILAKEQIAGDSRKAAYVLTEKGLDLLPVIFEIILWSAKHDGESEARRIPSLIDAIRADNRQVSRSVREKVQRGEGIISDYIGK